MAWWSRKKPTSSETKIPAKTQDPVKSITYVDSSGKGAGGITVSGPNVWKGGSSGGGAVVSSINSAVSVLNKASGGNLRGGLITYPEWWTVEVVSFAGGQGANVLMSMTDMLAKSMDVTMYAPFIGKDPSLVELSLGFSHGFRGLRESMSFGSGNASSGSSASGSNPSQPKSTPKQNNTSSRPVNTSSTTEDSRANKINLPFGLNNIR